MNLDEFPELLKLSTSKKILLIESLWDSIRSEEAEFETPESHKKELDKRKKTIKSKSLLTLDELKIRVEKSK